MKRFLGFLLIAGSLQVYADVHYVQVQGQIIDSRTHSPIVGSRVVFSDFETGVYTDENGRFSVLIPEGNHKVELSMMSYKPLELELDACRDMQISYEMKPDTYTKSEAMSSGSKSKVSFSAMDRFMTLLKYVFLHKLWD